MRDAWLDLVLGSSCGVCRLPGRILCELCARELPASARVAWPTPCPAGLARPVAAGAYDGGLKVLINAHKERAQFALARSLGRVLAHSVLAAVGDGEPAGTGSHPDQQRVVAMVPVPSRGSVVRARGHDPMLRVSRHAAVLLRRWGVRAFVVRLLRSTRAGEDQAGLGAVQRAENLAGAMACRARRAAHCAARWPDARYVVTDDVLTTGATAREAQRALEAGGLRVLGIATLAATEKRLPAQPS